MWQKSAVGMGFHADHVCLTCCSLAEIWNGNGKAWWQGARAASFDKLRAFAPAGISRLPCSEHPGALIGGGSKQAAGCTAAAACRLRWQGELRTKTIYY